MEAPSRLADWWCSLYTLFLSNKGLKLRIAIPDTFILRGGALSAWFQTSDDGYVVRLSPGKLTPENVYKSIVRKEVTDTNLNPQGYVAVAHFNRHASRLLRAEELEILLEEVDPPGQPPRALMGDFTSARDLPYCIQRYVPPIVDLRYVTTYSMEDGASCTTFARKFSSRYTHAHDDAQQAGHSSATGCSPSSPGARPRSALPMRSQDSASPSSRAPSAHRPHSSASITRAGAEAGYDNYDYGGGDQGGDEYLSYIPEDRPESPGLKSARLDVDPKVRAEIRRVVQSVVSFVERAHGLRLVGMVAETIRAYDGSMMLLAVHATQWDSRHTKGSMATYTERMNEFRSGAVAPPAAAPTNKSPTYLALPASPERGPISPHSGLHQLPEHQGVHDRPWTSGARTYHPPREGDESPTYLGRLSLDRPASRGWSGRSASPLKGGRKAYAGIRPGAGGSPTMREIVPSPKTRNWSPRTADAANNVQSETFNRDVIASLADDLEATKECLQQQYDAAARSEAALRQLHDEHSAAALNFHAANTSLEQSLQDTQADRNSLRAQVERLTARNEELDHRVRLLDEENVAMKETLASEREQASSEMRRHSAREGELRDENDALRADIGALKDERQEMQRRVTQEQEVVQAVRTQLVEYKLYIQQLEDRGNVAKVTSRNFMKGAIDAAHQHESKYDSTNRLHSGDSRRSRPMSPQRPQTMASPGRAQPMSPGRGRPMSAGRPHTAAPVPPLAPFPTGGGRISPRPTGGSASYRTSPRPVLSKASSIQEDPSQDQLSPRQFVPSMAAAGIAGDYYASVQAEAGLDDGAPNWMEISLGDLISGDGQPINSLHERHAAVIKVLQVAEGDLMDIYTFYCHLGRLVVRGRRATLGLGQFMKFARDTGCVESPEGSESDKLISQAQVEVIFTQVANSGILETKQGDKRFFFEGFLECVVRLACLKYGFDPRAELMEMVIPGAGWTSRDGDIPFSSPRSQKLLDKSRTAFSSNRSLQLAERHNHADLVTTLKVYLYNDVLPRARRNKLSGSAHAKHMAGSMHQV